MTRTDPNLETVIGPMLMKNPVMVASGTFGYGPEYADLVDLDQLGAIVVKGISLQPCNGNPPPRTVEVTSGLINAIGLQNPGVQGFVEDYLPFLSQFATPVLVNIWGRTLGEYRDVTVALDREEGIAGFEVNVSCPNIKEGSTTFCSNLDIFAEVISELRKVTHKALIPKLAPHTAGIAEYARAARDCGADAISLINTLPAMAIDIETRRPILGNRTGGLSGPAIHPVAVKLVWEAAAAVDIPIIGMGGIANANDAIELIVAGACAVAVGTANFTDPTTALRVIDGLRAYLVRHAMTLDDLVGSVRS